MQSYIVTVIDLVSEGHTECRFKKYQNKIILAVEI